MKEETTYHIPCIADAERRCNEHPSGRHVCRRNVWRRTLREILSRLEDGGRLIERTGTRMQERNIVNNLHFTFVRSNFRYLHNFLRYHGIEKWMPYLPTSAYLPITLMTANGDSPSASTGHWICA